MSARASGSRSVIGAGARRRVLVIAPYFPPRRRVGAQRPYRFVRYLPEYGVDPFVVCLRTPGESLSEVEARALVDTPRLELAAPFSGPPSARPPGPLRPRKPSRLRASLDARVPIDSWWPVLMAQLPSVLAAARRFAPDVVFSTADPWSAHALARHVCAALGRPWIADFRDPWSLCKVRGTNRPGWVRAIDARAERTYLQAAAAVTFTAARTTELYKRAYPGLAGRMYTIENGFDPAGYLEPVAVAQPRTAVAPEQALVLTFFGRFRPLSSARRIIDVLAALRALDPAAIAAVRVRSVDGLDAHDAAYAEKHGVAVAFEAHPQVALERALASLRSSDLLLLSTEPGRDEIIPAKLFDYLAAGRPVLSLGDNPDVAAILAASGAGVQLGQAEASEAAMRLLACVRAKQAGEPLPIAATLDPYKLAAWSAPTLTGRLAALIDRVCEA